MVIDTKGPFLYLVEGEGKATRYGIAVGREGFGWTGTGTIARSAQLAALDAAAGDDRARPASGEVARRPAGRGQQPAGRAGALHQSSAAHDSGYRIHGTNTPKSIGWAASSGCFRMLNQDVIDLYDRVPMGAKVVVM